MSFKCQSCNKPQGDGVKPVKVVTETRRVTYHTIIKNDREYTPEGWEIVKELELCESCAKRFN